MSGAHRRAAEATCAHGRGCDHGSESRPHALKPDSGPKTASDVRAGASPFAVSPVDETARRTRIERLKKLLDERIVLLDGAMGTMIQRHKLDEAGYRGERFRSYGRDVRGNNDLLTLTQPEVIAGIHRAYFEAGADIVETNTFNATTISQADYGMEALVPELNYGAAQLARSVADAFAQGSGRPSFVRDAFAGDGDRYSNGSGTPGPQRIDDDTNLHPRVVQARDGGAQSVGPMIPRVSTGVEVGPRGPSGWTARCRRRWNRRHDRACFSGREQGEPGCFGSHFVPADSMDPGDGSNFDTAIRNGTSARHLASRIPPGSIDDHFSTLARVVKGAGGDGPPLPRVPRRTSDSTGSTFQGWVTA